MDRCSIAVVEFLQCADRLAPTHVQLIRKSERLGFNFSNQALNKAPQIDPIAPTSIESPRAGSKIDRHRNRRSTNHRRSRGSFAKLLHCQFPPESESNQRAL